MFASFDTGLGGRLVGGFRRQSCCLMTVLSGPRQDGYDWPHPPCGQYSSAASVES